MTLRWIAFVVALGGSAAGVSAQGRKVGPPAGEGGNEGIGVTPAEIQRMFEAAALVRAQDALKLSDDKYLAFLAKYKALQDARRRGQVERQHIVQELRRL